MQRHYLQEWDTTALMDLALDVNARQTSAAASEVAILKAAYNHAARELDPPMVSRVPKFPKKLRESDPRSGFLTDDQYDKLQEQEEWRSGEGFSGRLG